MVNGESSPSSSPPNGRKKEIGEKPQNKNISEVPSSVFTDRSLSILERLVEHLKDNEGMTYHKIALALGRDDRTIWTCYHRAQQKRKMNE